MAGCPYCGGNHYTGEYVRLQAGVPEELKPEIGFNQCTACSKWSKYQSSDDNLDSIDQATIAEPLTRPAP